MRTSISDHFTSGCQTGGPDVFIEPGWAWSARHLNRPDKPVTVSPSNFFLRLLLFMRGKKVTNIVHLPSEHASTKLMPHLCAKAGQHRPAHTEHSYYCPDPSPFVPQITEDSFLKYYLCSNMPWCIVRLACHHISKLCSWSRFLLTVALLCGCSWSLRNAAMGLSNYSRC